MKIELQTSDSWAGSFKWIDSLIQKDRRPIHLSEKICPLTESVGEFTESASDFLTKSQVVILLKINQSLTVLCCTNIADARFKRSECNILKVFAEISI